MRTRWLSKSRIQSGRQCHKRLWLELHRPKAINWGPAAQARLDEGTRFGELARSLLGGGELVTAGHLEPDLALEQTSALLALQVEAVSMLFEPAFAHQGVRVRVDGLARSEQGDTLIEVKSTTSVKPEHLWDCAIQTWVVRGAGRNISRVQIGLVDPTFVYEQEGDYHGLLRVVDVTDEVEKLLPNIPDIVDELRQVAQGSLPDIATGSHCSKPYGCPFVGHCRASEPAGVEYPLSILPRASLRSARWEEQGYLDVRDIPDFEIQSPLHRRVIEATRSGQRYVSPELPELLKRIPFPRSYLDLETISFVMPRWIGTSPFQQTPFQYSLHTEHADGRIEHAQFLLTDGNSPLHGFVVSLLGAIAPTGPVIVWNRSFEASRLRELAGIFPQHAELLHGIIERMVDLLSIYREHYYHRDMRGSWSIKSVLPTIVPDLSYATLDIAEGVGAQLAYLRACAVGVPSEERASLCTDLLACCQRDTWAMVRLMHAFDVCFNPAEYLVSQ